MSDFYLTVPFPQAAPRSARLPGLEYVPEEVRAALEAAAAGRAHLDECRKAVDTCGLPTPHPRRTELEDRAGRAERDAARLFEEAQLLAAGRADAWSQHLHRMYFHATQRIEAAYAELAAAYAQAVGCARLLPAVKDKPHALTLPHGGPTPGIAGLLSQPVTVLREKLADGLPGITE